MEDCHRLEGFLGVWDPSVVDPVTLEDLCDPGKLLLVNSVIAHSTA